MSFPLTRYHKRKLLNATRDGVDFFNVEPKLYWAKPVYTYDGDTLHIVFMFNNKMTKWRVRLYGIDTCEMKVKKSWSKKRRRIAKARAIEIRDYVRNLVEDKIIKIQVINFEKYGRLLCNVYYGDNYDINLTQHLITNGMGLSYFGGTKQEQDIKQLEPKSKRRRL